MGIRRHLWRFHVWRAKRYAARIERTFWTDQRNMITASATAERCLADQRAMDAELAKVRRYVERLAWAARLGSDSARRRLRRLTFNYLGTEAARAASEALRSIDHSVTHQHHAGN